MAFQPRKDYSHLNAKELLDLVKASDAWAFAEFHERRLRDLYMFCLSFTAVFRKKYGVEEYAEDLTQDVFLKVWLYAGKFKDYGHTEYDDLEEQAHKWLCKIARNTYLSTLRKYKHALKVHLEEWQWEEVQSYDGEQDVSELFSSPRYQKLPLSRVAQLISEAIEQLPFAKRLVIDAVLKWCPANVPAWANREIAEILNIKPNSVIKIKTRLKEEIEFYVRSRLDSEDEGEHVQEDPNK